MSNISTRGLVESGDGAMIAGFIIGGEDPTTVIVWAIGPSLAAAGVSGALLDPTLELRDAEGSLLFANDNWQVYNLEGPSRGIAAIRAMAKS